MTTYLHTTTFNVYFSGVYTGKIHFTEQQIMLAKVDPRRRTQMQDNVLDGQFKTVLPLQKIHKHLDAYAKAEWVDYEVVLSNGDIYQKHIQYQAQIEGAN